MSKVFKDYRTISAEKKLQRQSKIPREWLLSQNYHEAANFMDVPLTCGILSDLECNITSTFDATALLEKLKDGTLSAEQVTVAFCKRAAIAHQLVRIPHLSCYNLVNSSSFVPDQLSNRDFFR
jgi:amidase